MSTKELEAKFNEQKEKRRLSILKALTEDDKATISIKRLADAIGAGCTKEQFQNAAWENLLPFGFGARSPGATSRGTVVLKDTFYEWYFGQK